MVIFRGGAVGSVAEWLRIDLESMTMSGREVEG
jgi:hypothetical protein